jgi:enamine deaminase RidA (YjgF/YER057c/UK114 family)
VSDELERDERERGERGSGVLGYVGRDGRRRVTSGGPWEARYGYSRAIVAGDACHVAGTTDAGPAGTARHPGAAEQVEAVLATIAAALEAAGFALADVVRTRMYVVDPADVAAVAEAHGRWFGDVRPAATLVLVAGLMDPSLRVEIEAEARRRHGEPG